MTCKMPLPCFFLILSILHLSFSTPGANSRCVCMEYWKCALRSGQIFSYCSDSESEVCCFVGTTNSTSSSVPKHKSNRPRGVLRHRINQTNFSNDDASAICGRAGTQGSALDSQAVFAEWPWHVAILDATTDLYLCGGAIISPRLIITAAHCVFSSTPKDLKIRAGEYDVSGNFEPEPFQEVTLQAIHINPNFNEGTLANDIAVLVLETSLKWAHNIRPICLPPQKPLRSRKSRQRNRAATLHSCVVTGWGRTSKRSNHAHILKEVLVTPWPHNQCETELREKFGSKYHLPANTICAKDNVTRISNPVVVCEGDGGGPMMCLDESSKYILQGVVSFGIGCGNNLPGVYTKTASFLQWIASFSGNNM